MNRIISFEEYIAFLLDTIVLDYNHKHYPHMDKFELSNQFYLIIYNSFEDNELNLIALDNFINFLKDFNNVNYIKNQSLLKDIILYLEFIINNKLSFKLFENDILLLNKSLVFKDLNLLKYYDDCLKFYMKENNEK